MIPDRDDHLLDAAIRRALRPEPIEFDPNAWKSNHPEEVGLLDSWKTTHPGAPGTADAHGFLRRHAMKLSLAAAATIVLAVLSAIPFNGKPAAGVAWADMAQQLRSARTARVQRIITPDPASEKGVSEDTFLWKAPDLSRTDSVKPRKFTTICNGKNKLTLDPQKKTYAMESTQAFEGSMDWLLALAAVPPAPRDGTTTSPEVTIEDTKVALVPELIQQRDGRKLRKYRMMLPDNHGAPGEVKYAWFEVKTGKLAMFTSEMPVAGKLREIAVVKVELDIDLPYYLFSLKPPAGYQKAAARSMSSPGSIPTVSAAGRPAAFNSYLEARDQLNRYTLVVWSKRKDAVLPAGRSSREGERYRSDWLDISNGKEKVDRYAELTASAPFDRAEPWKDLAAFNAIWALSDRKLMRATTLDYRGAPASIQSYMRMAGGGDSPSSFGSDINADRYLLSSLGWPLHFDGQEIIVDGQPFAIYTQLPKRPDRADLVGVRVETNPARRQIPGSSCSLTLYWLDPAKDFLCVRNEHYQRADQPWQGNLNWQPAEPVGTEPPKAKPANAPRVWEIDTITRIVEFGRTPAGRWYPLVLQRDNYPTVEGRRYGPTSAEELHLQIEFDQPMPAEQWNWPAGVPEPQPISFKPKRGAKP